MLRTNLICINAQPLYFVYGTCSIISRFQTSKKLYLLKFDRNKHKIAGSIVIIFCHIILRLIKAFRLNAFLVHNRLDSYSQVFKFDSFLIKNELSMYQRCAQYLCFDLKKKNTKNKESVDLNHFFAKQSTQGTPFDSSQNLSR